MRNYQEIEKIAKDRFGVIIHAVATRNFLYVTIDKSTINKWPTIEDFVSDVIMFHKYKL